MITREHELLTVVSKLVEKKSQFSLSVASAELTTLQWEATHLRPFGQHKMILMGTKKNPKLVNEEGGVNLKRTNGVGMNMFKACWIKFSKN